MRAKEPHMTAGRRLAEGVCACGVRAIGMGIGCEHAQTYRLAGKFVDHVGAWDSLKKLFAARPNLLAPPSS